MKTGYYKIITWNDMKKEFGITSFGDINCDNIFMMDMEFDMPEDRIIYVKDDVWSTKKM